MPLSRKSANQPPTSSSREPSGPSTMPFSTTTAGHPTRSTTRDSPGRSRGPSRDSVGHFRGHSRERHPLKEHTTKDDTRHSRESTQPPDSGRCSRDSTRHSRDSADMLDSSRRSRESLGSSWDSTRGEAPTVRGKTKQSHMIDVKELSRPIITVPSHIAGI